MSSSSNSSSSKQASKAGKKKRSKGANKKKKQSKASKFRAATSGLPAASYAQDYIASLNDPFENSGCRLGWGCLVPSTMVTAYVKGSATSNADGTLALSLIPIVTGMVNVANGGAAVSFATSATLSAAADQAAISANYSAGRIISAGIRAYPNLPMTSAPGSCYVGSIPELTYTQSQAMTPNDLAASPFMKQFRGYEGGTAVSHPQDTFSFEFDTRNVDASITWSGNNDLPSSNPYIAFFGIGSGTAVFFEAIINYEVIAKSQHLSAALSTNDKQPGKKLSDYWPSVESLWSSVKPYLAAAGRYGAQTALTYAAGSSASSAVGSRFSTVEQFAGTPFRLGKGL